MTRLYKWANKTTTTVFTLRKTSLRLTHLPHTLPHLVYVNPRSHGCLHCPIAIDSRETHSMLRWTTPSRCMIADHWHIWADTCTAVTVVWVWVCSLYDAFNCRRLEHARKFLCECFCRCLCTFTCFCTWIICVILKTAEDSWLHESSCVWLCKFVVRVCVGMGILE